MTKKELCRMCTEYNSDIRCDNEQDCKLLNLLKENKHLKEEVKSLKKENERSSWERFPDEMGK